MAAQSGKDMLLKLDATGSDSFVTVAGLRTRSLAFNAAAAPAGASIGPAAQAAPMRSGAPHVARAIS